MFAVRFTIYGFSGNIKLKRPNSQHEANGPRLCRDLKCQNTCVILIVVIVVVVILIVVLVVTDSSTFDCKSRLRSIASINTAVIVGGPLMKAILYT